MKRSAVLVSARTGSIFSGRKHGQTQTLFNAISWEEMQGAEDVRDSLQVGESRVWWERDSEYFVTVFLCKWFLSLILVVINTVAVTVFYLLSLLFPVNCSYLKA